MRNLVSTAIISAALSIAASSVFMPAAQAQFFGYVDGGFAPIYSNPVFQGDARCSDLYSYLHPTDPGPWYDYRQLVEQIAAQSDAAIPPPIPIPVSRPYPFNPIGALPLYDAGPSNSTPYNSYTYGGQQQLTPFDSPPGLVQ